MKLFPHSLLRVAGASFDELDQLEIDESILKNYFNKKGDFEKIKKKIDTLLYDFIGSLKDRNQQNYLLNFKRDIYNDRPIDVQRLERVYELTDDELKETIEKYFELIETIVEIEKKGEAHFSKEVVKDRKNFRELLEEEPLKQGLLLSSKSLLKGIEKYKSAVKRELNRNELKVEQGSLQYVTRMRTKTSPFSTFTNLSIVEHLSNNEHDIYLQEQQNGNRVDSHVRLNNYLFRYLKAVIFSNIEIAKHFLVRANPTIRIKDNFFVFLTNNNNVESFQRIEMNPLLELLYEKLSETKKGILLSDIVDFLTNHVDASEEDLQNFVTELIKYGLLEFNLEVSGISTEWDQELIQKLEPLENREIPYMAELRSALSTLRNLAQKYGNANVNQRDKLLESAYNEFKGIALKLHKAADLPEEERMSFEERRAFQKEKKKEQEAKIEDEEKKDNSEESDNVPFKHQSNTYFNFKPKNIFYEDTTLNISANVDEGKTVELINRLNELLHSLRFSKGIQNEQDKMLHFFNENYAERDQVGLFNFYEDYYREVKKPEAEEKRNRMQQKAENKNGGSDGEGKEEKNDSENGNKSNIASIQDRNELLEKWTEAFKQNLNDKNERKDSDIINVCQEEIDSINEELNIYNHSSRRNSLGTFIQLYRSKNGNNQSQIKGVLNGTFSGFGKMMSRFLHLFDEEIKEQLCDWNVALSDVELFLENTDASFFNANLHSPLMPDEVWIPGGHNALGEEHQIPVTDLAVKVNRNNDELKLIHQPDGKRAYLFDLGFQGRMGRSQLFQMLSNFTLADYLFYHPVVNAVDQWIFGDDENDDGEKKGPGNEVLEFPRIEYENAIILRRKKWQVPKTKLPYRDNDETDWNYFLKVNEWRRAYSIPKEVFVFVMTRQLSGNLSNKQRLKLARDDYKPQYINFKNPLLVSLFEKLVRKVPFSMKIEEMLPGSDQLLKINDKRFVTEFMIQWYNFKN